MMKDIENGDFYVHNQVLKMLVIKVYKRDY